MNNPCVGCGMFRGYCLNGDIKCVREYGTDGCAPYNKYLGYQECQAECEARIHKREQEIVEWLLKEEFRDAASWMEGIRPKESLNKRLESWLGKE